MRVTERDFSNFYLHDDVYELANGLIPEIAERLDIDAGAEANSEVLGALVGKLGPNKVIRDNVEVTAINAQTMADMVERSGVQQPLSRSLWTPNITVTSWGMEAIVASGAVANWQDRTATLLEAGQFDKPVYYVTGGRVMDTGTEQTNPNIINLLKELGRYPTETEYAAGVIIPKLVTAGYEVEPVNNDNPKASGDELAALLFAEYPGLLDRELAFARVANAGVQLALQMRKAAQAVRPGFDSDPIDPQVFVLTDTLPVSRSAEQDADPQHYQKAQTALRQVVVAARLLHEAN